MAQSGTLYLNDGTWYLKYRTTEGSRRVHKTEKLCSENGEQHHPLCPELGEHRSRKHPTKKTRDGNAVTIPPKNLNAVRNKFMEPVNAQQQPNKKGRPQDMSVTDFWEKIYLPYCEKEWKGEGMKPSTIRGMKHVWAKYLADHFEGESIQRYTSDRASFLMNTLKTKMNKTSLTHIKAYASGIFGEAVEKQYRRDNPWYIKLPKSGVKESKDTQHYTLGESENLVSALIDHVDAQLFLSLCCFLGLRPSEAIAVKWEDFDGDVVHIRRGCVNGHVDTLKTKGATRDLPLTDLDAVLIPLELWRQKCGNPTGGWVFKKTRKIGEDVPADLHNLVNRVIKPHVKGDEKCTVCDIVPKKANVEWKGIYSARRGFATAIIGLTGDYASAQALLGHSSMETTVRHYKKITETAKKKGIAALAAATTPKALNAGEG